MYLMPVIPKLFRTEFIMTQKYGYHKQFKSYIIM